MEFWQTVCVQPGHENVDTTVACLRWLLAEFLHGKSNIDYNNDRKHKSDVQETMDRTPNSYRKLT